MARYVVRRLAFMLVTVIAASLIIFFATRVLPGDVATMVLGRFASEASKEALRHQLGMDRPLAVQYLNWAADFARGDWGATVGTGEPVRHLVLSRLQNSAMLAALALLLYVPLGVVFGMWAALRRNSWVDHTLSIGSLAVIGLPEFVVGLVLIAVFAIQLQWLPAQSSIDPATNFVAALPYLVLPAITVSLSELGYVLRMTRSGTVDVLRADYVRTARLKGFSPRRVLFGHVMRNALLPTITIVAIGIGWLIGGLIVTEEVFSYPGIGRLLLFAVQRRDVALIQAVSIVIIVIFCMSNLIADILYAYLNPRIRYT